MTNSLMTATRFPLSFCSFGLKSCPFPRCLIVHYELIQAFSGSLVVKVIS